MSAMEQPLRPSKTFEDAVATLRTWQSKLRIVLHDLNARPEPLRLFNSVLPLIDSLTHTDSDFSYSVSFLTRSTRVRTECTLENFLAFVEGLESELGLRATQEQEKKRRQQSGGSAPQGYGNAAQEEEEDEETHAVRKGKGRGRGKGDRKEKSKSTQGDQRNSPAQKPKQSPNPRRNDSQGRKGSRKRSKSPKSPLGKYYEKPAPKEQVPRRVRFRTEMGFEEFRSGTEIESEERTNLPGLSLRPRLPERRVVSKEPPSNQWQQRPFSG